MVLSVEIPRHAKGDLRQMQSLPLDYKILMTKERIKAWYQTWTKFVIHDKETGKTRSVTIDARDFHYQDAKERFKLKDSEYVFEEYPGQVYVSFSGGKDSTVLKHIVDSMYSDVPAVFVNTGLEYPEIQQFVRDVKSGKWDCFNPDVEILRPEMRFDEVIKKYGYPVISKEVSNTVSGARKNIRDGKYSLRLRQLGVQCDEYGGLYNSGKHDYEKTVTRSKFTQNKWRFLLDSDFEVSEKCCYHTKKAPSKKYEKETGRKPLIATMACESMTREAAWMKKGCNAFDAPRPTSQPMSFWTEQDVLHYIKKYDVPYCSVYGDIQVKQKVDNDKVFEGQMNIIDYLGCYEPEDTLETTGCDRTGCIFCMFGCHLEKEPNRFQRLKQTHPRQYEYCICGGEMVNGKWQPNKKGLGLGHVLDYIGVKYD